MSMITQLQQLQGATLQQLQQLYQQIQFPMEVRYYCAPWIEAQQWGSIDTDSPSSEPAATILLQQLVQQINEKCKELTGETMFVIRMRLDEFAKALCNRFGKNPLEFVRVVLHCLESEKRLVEQVLNGMQGSVEQAMPVPDSHSEIQTVLQNLQYKCQAQEKALSDMQQKQELFIVRHQEMLQILQSTQSSQQYPADEAARQAEEARINQKKMEMQAALHSEANRLMEMRVRLERHHEESYVLLNQVQNQVLKDELVKWKRQQQLAGIGGSPADSLDTLQSWCESLAEITWQNIQQISRVELLKQRLPMKSTSPQQDLSTRLTGLLSTLVTSTFIIEKQPPQVMKKETRFPATVRLLVGGKLNVHMNPPQVKATIISEAQAKALMHNESTNLNEASGDILNNCGVMEFHKDTGILSVNFRNMSLKKIKRADRRGAEFVTEEKFTILFQSNFAVASGELVFQVRTLSLPVVVIVHGNQESNALATVLWDNAFADPDRIPFVTPDKVPWPSMAQALNSKFMAANGRSLSNDNLQYLAMKAFSSQNLQADEFNNMYISWSTFNRDPLPGCTFTFWKWFYGVVELTRKHLRPAWNDGSILGFIRKEQAQELLLTKQTGTFLLRFSDSKIGAISITWVNEDPTRGDRRVLNLLPFSSEDFHIRSLADRIHDLPNLTHLFPDIPKDTAFGNFYTLVEEKLPRSGDGYVSSMLVSKIPQLPQQGYPMDGPGSLMGTVEQVPLQDQPHAINQDYESYGSIADTFDDVFDEQDQNTDRHPGIEELLEELGSFETFQPFDVTPPL